jgi:hypothetical protein
MLNIVRRYKRFWMWDSIRMADGVRLKVCRYCKYTYLTSIKNTYAGETCMDCPKCSKEHKAWSGYPQGAVEYHKGRIRALYQWITKREYREIRAGKIIG